MALYYAMGGVLARDHDAIITNILSDVGKAGAKAETASSEEAR